MFDHGRPQWTIALQNVQVILKCALELFQLFYNHAQDLVHFYKLKQLPETRQTVDGKHLIRYHVQVS